MSMICFVCVILLYLNERQGEREVRATELLSLDSPVKVHSSGDRATLNPRVRITSLMSSRGRNLIGSTTCRPPRELNPGGTRRAGSSSAMLNAGPKSCLSRNLLILQPSESLSYKIKEFQGFYSGT